MKRCVWNGMRVGMVLLTAAVFSGCVSQAKYDELKFAQRNCEAERERLAAELANANTTIKMQAEEIRRLKELLKNREDIINALRGKIGATDEALRKMADIYQQLANKNVPFIQPALPQSFSNALKDFAAKYPNLVQYDEKTGVLKFVSDLLFDLGSAQVKPDVIPALQEFAKIMERPDAAQFDCVVVGHTDNVRIGKPSTRALHPTNWHLSVHRAISVMQIVRDAGVDSTRLGVMGYGEFRPVVANEGNRGNPKNRRVEIYIVPKQGVGVRGMPQDQTSAAPSAPATGGEETAAPAQEEESAAPAEEKAPVEK